MGKEFEVSDAQSKSFASAASQSDGIAAAKLLEEVGSCGWKSLVSKANQDMTGAAKLGSSLELTKFNGSSVIEVFAVSNQNTTPLAKVHDVKCDLKKDHQK